MMWQIFLLISFFSNAQDEASLKPSCSSRVAADCGLYKKNIDTQNFELTDGTAIPNPMNQNNGNQKIDKVTIHKRIDNTENALELQTKVMDILGNQASTPFKLAFLDKAVLILAEEENGESLIPWPINSTNYKIENKSHREIVKSIQETIGHENMNLLKEILKNNIEHYKIAKKNNELSRIQQIENNAKIEKRKKEIEQLVIQLKDDLKNIISRGKSNLTSEEKLLIAKIDNIHINFNGENNPICRGGKENAFYSPFELELSICPSFYFRPDVELASILGHEISHSIDPCQSQMPIYKINKEKLQFYLTSVAKKLNTHDKGILTELLNSKSNIISYDLELLLRDRNVLGSLTLNEIIVKTQEGISKEKYPFKKEVQCLANNLNMVGVTTQDINETERYLQRRQKNTSSNINYDQASINTYIKFLNKYPDCLRSSTHHSQLGEASSDMFGTLLQETQIKKEMPLSELKKTATVEFFARAVCLENTKKAERAPFEMQRSLNELADPHPHSNNRIERILLNLPTQAELFGCKRDWPACFDHLSLVKRSADQSLPRQEMNK